jgi:hypothetical protein
VSSVSIYKLSLPHKVELPLCLSKGYFMKAYNVGDIAPRILRFGTNL